MKRRMDVWLVVGAALIVASCRDSTVESRVTPTGRYEYVAVDSTGTVKQSGVLDIVSEGGSALRGELLLNEEQKISLAGTFNNETIFLDLAVGCHDCFYVLEGSVGSADIRGRWMKGRLIVEDKGSFVARRL